MVFYSHMFCSLFVSPCSLWRFVYDRRYRVFVKLPTKKFKHSGRIRHFSSSTRKQVQSLDGSPFSFANLTRISAHIFGMMVVSLDGVELRREVYNLHHTSTDSNAADVAADSKNPPEHPWNLTDEICFICVNSPDSFNRFYALRQPGRNGSTWWSGKTILRSLSFSCILCRLMGFNRNAFSSSPNAFWPEWN